MAIGAATALVAALVPDPYEGAAAAVALGTFAIGAVRDAMSHILWPEIFQIALATELGLRVLDGHASDAAIGCAVFGAAAWALVLILQVLGIPQGSGDTLPVFLIGASYPILAGVTGVSLGFFAYSIFVLLTRTRNRAERTLQVPMGPAFALTSVAATILTSTLHYG